jgi:hypothetical protein
MNFIDFDLICVERAEIQHLIEIGCQAVEVFDPARGMFSAKYLKVIGRWWAGRTNARHVVDSE